MLNLLSLAIVFALAACTTQIGHGPKDDELHDVVVLLKSGVSLSSSNDLQVARAKATKVYDGVTKGFVAKLTTGEREALLKSDAVKVVEEDKIAWVSEEQSLSYLQWGLDRLDSRQLDLDSKYKYDSTGTGVDVYIVDTGIRLNHQEFVGRALSHWDYVNNDSDASDDHGHGTHVAGTVGGSTVGVAKGVTLWATKVLSESGWGTYSNIISAINDITQIKINSPTKKIIGNMSLGGGKSDALNAAIDASTAAGVIWAVAAGNDDWDACDHSPASAVSALTVGATNYDDTRSWFSNWGTCVDLFAPGRDIYSSTRNGTNTYESWSGTSMATPHVTGAAALYLSANPHATTQETIDWVKNNSTPDVLSYIGDGSPNRMLCTLDVVQTRHILRVSDMDVDAKRPTKNNHGNWWDYSHYRVATVSIEIKDENSSPVAEAVVRVSWSGDHSQCLTGIDGRCSIRIKVTYDSTAPVMISVTSVTKQNYTYDPSLNSDVEGDSTGSHIALPAR